MTDGCHDDTPETVEDMVSKHAVVKDETKWLAEVHHSQLRRRRIMQPVRIIVSITVITLLSFVVHWTQAHALLREDKQLVGATKASDLIGKEVTNLQGKNLGEIKDLVINWRSGGYIEYAVLSFGGFLGLGDKYFAVPWEVMALSGDKEQFILNVKEERLKNAPGFDKDNWPDMSRPEWALVVYQFYGLDPTHSKPVDRSKSAEASQTMSGDVPDFTNAVREALNHAMEAESAGKKGKSDALVAHAKKSLDSAKRAQRSGHNERLNEGVYALGEAIEHGEKQQTADATEHMMHAIMKLSQSAELQIPDGIATGRSITN